MRVSIPISGLLWGGGAELITIICTALFSADNKTQIYLLVDNEHHLISKLFANLFMLFTAIRSGSYKKAIDIIKVLFRNPTSSHDKAGNLRLEQFLDFSPAIRRAKIINTSYTPHALEKLHSKYSIHVMIASTLTIPKPRNYSIIGYISDFQHLHLKHNFTFIERIRRNYIFAHILKNSSGLICNSKFVSNCIKQYYPAYSHPIYSLPFGAYSGADLYSQITKFNVDKYELPRKFFLISNQFWIHKGHSLAIDAFVKFHKFDKSIHLICTGVTNDYRDPSYFKKIVHQIYDCNLTNYIHILGHIPKIDQLAIMHKAIAVIQPTTYEGGPGGGSVYNAISLGVPCVVSDIPINKELPHANIIYFRSGSVSKLVLAMKHIVNHHKRSNYLDVLHDNSQRIKVVGEYIIRIIRQFEYV